MIKMKDYDVIYIGSGNAAWQGARQLCAEGMNVLIIEKDKYGGTCPNYGCHPKILLDGPFELTSAMHRYPDIEKNDTFNVNWPNLMKFKNEVIGQFSPLMKKRMKEFGIDVISGFGEIIDEHTVQVNNENYHTDLIVIATGLKPVIPDIKGKEYLHDSNDFLSIPELPDNVTIIGAGIIAMEFASILSEAGSNVDIIVHSDKVLRKFYQPYVAKVVQKLEDNNVKFHYNQTVTEVIENDETYTILTEDKHEYTTDYIICAIGREANVEDIGLEKVGLTYNTNGIPVNGYMQTDVPNIYASGDVADTSLPKLVTIAIYQSKYIAKRILGKTGDEINYPVVPRVVYTLPRIATVGVSASDVADNENYELYQLQYGKSYLTELKNETDAEITVVTDKNKNIVGVEAYSSEAENIVNLFTIIINKKISLEELDQMIYAFPSSSTAVIYKLHHVQNS